MWPLSQVRRPPALPAPAPAPADPGSLATTAAYEPIDVDTEEYAEAVDWSASGLALPVGFAPAAPSFGQGLKAFGKVVPASRTTRGAPYGSSELADGLATAQLAEQLLASSSGHPGPPEAPGGATVKLESASA